MSETINLPVSGASVTLRDPHLLRQKDREKVWASFSQLDNILIQGVTMTKGLIALIVESWDLDLIIPSVNISSLGELMPGDFDALAEKAADAQTILFGSGFDDTLENESNPDSPKDNLSDSSGS